MQVQPLRGLGIVWESSLVRPLGEIYFLFSLLSSRHLIFFVSSSSIPFHFQGIF